MEKIRLQKILANAGLFSRRKAEEAMAEGRVTVNGEVVTELGSKADPDTDTIVCDGARIEPQGKFYLMMNKPAGVITSCADDRGRKTVIDLVAEEMAKRVFPIGRLDYNTTGLLLLTNDGEFSQKLSHPSHGVVKTYMAKVRGVVTPETIKKMLGGITIEGEKYRFHGVRVDHVTGKNSVLMVELTEGKNLIIKILCQALGHPVAKLARVSYGPQKLGNLGLGDYRHLEKDEVRALLGAAKAKPKSKLMPPERYKDELVRRTAPTKDFAGRNRPFSPPRRDSAGGDRPFAAPRRDSTGGGKPFSPPRRDFAGGDRPFSAPRRDSAGGGRPFSPPRRDSAGGDRPFAAPRRDSASGGRPFSPPRRDSAGGGRPFSPPRRDSAGGRPSEGRGPGSDRKPAKPFSPRSSGAKRR